MPRSPNCRYAAIVAPRGSPRGRFALPLKNVGTPRGRGRRGFAPHSPAARWGALSALCSPSRYARRLRRALTRRRLPPALACASGAQAGRLRPAFGGPWFCRCAAPPGLKLLPYAAEDIAASLDAIKRKSTVLDYRFRDCVHRLNASADAPMGYRAEKLTRRK